MRKLYYYDNIHQRRRKQQQQQLIDCTHRSNNFGDNNGKHRHLRRIGAILSNYYVATKHNVHDENVHISHRHIESHHHQQQEQQKQLNQLTKCAKMSEENGMIKNGNLNGVGVGIARSLSQNLTNFSNFTISPSTTITPPLPPPPPLPIPLSLPVPSSAPASTTTATSTTTTIANTTPAIASAAASTTSSSTSTGTSNSLANSISNSNNAARANNESTANTTSPSNNGHNGSGGGAGAGAGGGGGSGASAGAGGDTSNSDFGDQKPTNNNNGNNIAGTHPNPIGGRMQIFKDGKFILELACSKEGERSGWVSVPRKTYWPPAAPSSNNNSVNHNKNESSTSLSFSDDNSSIQSSPWQRDHCWKQPSPRRNISKELCLHYWRPTDIVLHAKCRRISKLKSRRPHDTRLSANQRVEYAKRAISTTTTTTSRSKAADETKEKVPDAVKASEEPDVDTVDSGESSAKPNESKSGENVDAKKSKTSPTRRPTSDEHEMAVDNENRDAKSPIRATRIKRPKLNDILQKLIDKLAEQPQSVVGMQTGPGASALLSGGNGTSRSSDLGYYQQHVSPRKRILREFEKVSLEDAANTSTSTKRSRSKGGINSNASPDASRTANGNRHANTISDGSPKTTQSATLYSIGQSNVTPATSRPISSYSITSLLGHNSSGSSSTSTNSAVKLDNGQRMSPKSPQQPSTARMPKKKSPINGSTSVGSPLGLTSSSFGSHRSPMNSPVNYGGRSTRSPDVNSPSPDHHHSMRNHAQRYAFGGGTASISSPTSGFHPYLPTSRASPLSSGADALSPNTLDRYRSSYRAAASPSGTSSSSISGPSHAYASANGSPNAHMMRYSPSTYGSNAQISPPHQKSSPYNINSLLPHTIDSSNGNSTVCRDISISQNYSPNSTKPREQSPPPSSSSSRSTKSSATSNNNTPTRTIPKKTASLRQQFGSSVSPNGADTKTMEAPASTEHRRHGWDANTTPSRHGHDMDTSSVNTSPYQSLPISSSMPRRLPHFSPAELEQQQAYLAAAALHSLNAPLPLPLPPPAPPPWPPIHSSNRPSTGAGPFFGGVSVPTSAMPAAAYLNPLYYHPITYSNPFRSPFWMPYPTAHPTHPEAEWSGEMRREAERNAAIIECRRGTAGEYDSFQSIREEQNSDVPLNLSKH